MRFPSVLPAPSLTRALTLALTGALTLSCSATLQGTGSPSASAKDGSAAGAANGAKHTGVFAPVDFAAISIWPAAWSGELLVLEVLPHGTTLAEGDVIARLDTRSIDEALTDAELELTSTRVRHESLMAQQVIDEQATVAALEQGQASLDRARRSLEGWMQHELAFAERSDEVQALREKSWIEDQEDELEQLQAMYDADELVDATEEIVLKRARRDLAQTNLSTALSLDRRVYRVAFDQAMETEKREEAVRMQTAAFDRTKRSKELERRARVDAVRRSVAALEKRQTKLERLRADRVLFELRAPRAGVLLHGKADDYRPGKTPGQLERGSRITTRSDVFLVAAPDRVGVAFDVPEAQIEAVATEASARVRPVARPASATSGRLDVPAWPRPGAQNAVFEAMIELDEVPTGARFGMHVSVDLGDEEVEG